MLKSLFFPCLLLMVTSTRASLPKDVLELNLDSTWKCIVEGTEHVCQRKTDDRKEKTILIWTAKAKGPQDTFNKYLDHLKSPIKRNFEKNKPVASVPQYTRITNIEGRQWIDSLHWESEMPGFYTRYLASVGDKISVLITFSATKNNFDKANIEVQPALEKMKFAH